MNERTTNWEYVVWAERLIGPKEKIWIASQPTLETAKIFTKDKYGIYSQKCDGKPIYRFFIEKNGEKNEFD